MFIRVEHKLSVMGDTGFIFIISSVDSDRFTGKCALNSPIDNTYPRNASTESITGNLQNLREDWTLFL